MIAKELTIKEAYENGDETLPLDNLDQNMISADALFTTWPLVDAIIGNPPFQSKNKMQEEFGIAYVNKLREAYPLVPGRADFCVYWFYKAHQNLKDNRYAGLVGTNTIRQNYSREGSLDIIVNNGGEIFSAVSSIDWSGEAAVFVSIACWKKGQYDGEKELYADEEKQLTRHILPFINSSLSLHVDVSIAHVLECNKKPKKVFQGQTHGHEGFLLSKTDGLKILKQHQNYADVLKPFLIGEELVGNFNAQPTRFVIDFTDKDILVASTYKDLYKIIEKKVLPTRTQAYQKQLAENQAAIVSNPKAKVNKHHINFYNKWWKLSYGREDMLESISKISRYVALSRVSLRPLFEFVSSNIQPSDALMVFAFEDDYSFGIIQSSLHWNWYLEKCSTLGNQFRYTTDSIWDTFPFPQTPTEKQVEKVAKAAKALHTARTAALQQHHLSLRDLYRLLEQPGNNPIKTLHQNLDAAVAEAYGITALDANSVLTHLLALNQSIASKEKQGIEVTAPGLPAFVSNPATFISNDCVQFEW